MIDFIRKKKNLKDIFEKAEQSYIKGSKQEEVQMASNPVQEAVIEDVVVDREFYEVLCEEFCDQLIAKDIKYDESLIKINIQFNKGELAYKICFPLIEISETKTQIFVSTLKDSIKKNVSADYSVNLCLMKDDETHNVILILERVESTNKKVDTRENLREEA